MSLSRSVSLQESLLISSLSTELQISLLEVLSQKEVFFLSLELSQSSGGSAGPSISTPYSSWPLHASHSASVPDLLVLQSSVCSVLTEFVAAVWPKYIIFSLIRCRKVGHNWNTVYRSFSWNEFILIWFIFQWLYSNSPEVPKNSFTTFCWSQCIELVEWFPKISQIV